jgi:peptidyl-prolyl cis-trans isomerase D
MFIAHGEKVRKHSKWILGAVLVLLIPGFIALFTTTSSSDRQMKDVPKIKGKELPAGEYINATQAVRDLYVVNSGRRPASTPELEDSIKQEAIVRLLILRQAKEMGLRVSTEAVFDFVRRMPVFRNEGGQFDADRYTRYLIYLNNQGITEARFEQLMRDQFLIAQVEMAVADGAKLTPQELEMTYAPFHEKLWIELVAFNTADIKDKPAVTDAEAQKEFDSSRETYRKPAQVKVRYALFSFDAVQKAVQITDAEIQEYYDRNKGIFTNSFDVAKEEIRKDLSLVAAQRKAGELAEQFSVKLVPEPNAARLDFAKLAAEAGAKVGETGYFAQSDKIDGVKAGRGFMQAAFALSYRPEPPFSDPVAGEDGYYVLEYLAGKPSRIPEFAEVKAEVVAVLVEQRLREATGKQGRDALDKVRALVLAGQPFAIACAEQKLVVENHGPFTFSDRKLDIPGAVRIGQATMSMPTNTISEFIPTEQGGVFFNLKDRQPYDRADFEANKGVLTQELLLRNRQAMFHGWLESLWRDNQVDLGARRTRPAATPEPDEEPQPQPVPAPKS